MRIFPMAPVAPAETGDGHTAPMTARLRPPVATARKGRGSASWVAGRFEQRVAVAEDDGWDALQALQDEATAPATTVTEERARSIVSRNDSPDIGFSQSVNPYRGCEHGMTFY